MKNVRASIQGGLQNGTVYVEHLNFVKILTDF